MSTFKRNASLSLLSSLLLFLSFPSANLFILAWAALIPLLFVLARQDRLGSFFYGFLAAFAAYLGLFYWIFLTVKSHTASVLQGIAALVALSAYVALYVGLWAVLLRSVRSRLAGFRFSLFAAALWVSLEYLRAHLLTGFPWVLLGYSQWQFLSLVQVAEYTGVYGISFVIILFNASLYQALRTKHSAAFLGTAMLLLAVLATGRVLINVNDDLSPPYIKAAVIQGNIDQYKKWDAAYEREIIDTYTELVKAASAHQPDIFIWPETSVPGYLPADARIYAWVSGLARDTRSYHLVGSPYFNGGKNYYNSILLFGPEGEILGWHWKTHLVPFGEYVPLRKVFAPVFGVLNALEDFSQGEQGSVLSAKSILWGPTICSENFFGHVVRRFVLKGADILVNQTNDAWFFDTSAPEQHFVMNVFRAVENRRTVVACGNTGLSGVVEPTGFVSRKIPVFTKDYFLYQLSPQKRITFYTRWGDVFAVACIVIVGVFLTAFLAGRVSQLVYGIKKE